MRIKASLAAVVAAVAVVGCGGNDNNNNGGGTGVVTPPVTSMVPASASASVVGFIAYLQQLVVSFADTLEPVDTSAVTGPTDDTIEPIKVD